MAQTPLSRPSRMVLKLALETRRPLDIAAVSDQLGFSAIQAESELPRAHRPRLPAARPVPASRWPKAANTTPGRPRSCRRPSNGGPKSPRGDPGLHDRGAERSGSSVREHTARPYHCTVQLGQQGPQAGVFIDDPDAPAWRADFLGELPTAWCVPEPGAADTDAPGREPGRRVTVTILTGLRTGQPRPRPSTATATGRPGSRGSNRSRPVGSRSQEQEPEPGQEEVRSHDDGLDRARRGCRGSGCRFAGLTVGAAQRLAPERLAWRRRPGHETRYRWPGHDVVEQQLLVRVADRDRFALDEPVDDLAPVHGHADAAAAEAQPERERRHPRRKTGRERELAAGSRASHRSLRRAPTRSRPATRGASRRVCCAAGRANR